MTQSEDRECGDCSVCCTYLRIEQPDLQKQEDTPCPNLCDKGCSIYPSRPSVCRNWLCGWKVMPQLPEEMRPDISNLLVSDWETGESIKFTAMKDARSVLTTETALSFIGGAIENNFKVFISFHVRDNFQNVRLELTSSQNFLAAHNSKNLDAVKRSMLEAIDFGMQVETNPIEPITK